MSDKTNLPKGWEDIEDDDYSVNEAFDDSESDFLFAKSNAAEKSENNLNQNDPEQSEAQTKTSCNTESDFVQSQNAIDSTQIISESNDNDVIYYTPEKDKKPILIAGITFALILIIAAFIIIPKIADKRSSSDLKSGQPASDNKIAEVSEQETTTQEATTEAATTALTESTTVTTSQTTETTTVTTTTTPVATAPPVDYKALYTKKLEEYKQSLYFTSSDEYGVADTTGDGIPELFIYHYNEIDRQADVYIYKDTAYQLVDAYFLADVQVNPELHLLQYFDYEFGHGRYIISLSSDGTATQTDSLVKEYDNSTYYRKGNSISQEEYNKAENYYNSLGWQAVTIYSFANINASNNLEYYQTYNQYSIPRDFSVYDFGYSAYVNVKDGGLNLRTEPSTDSSVITLLTKGTNVRVRATNGLWSYVEYALEDAAIAYYGYVSNEFLAYN